MTFAPDQTHRNQCPSRPQNCRLFADVYNFPYCMRILLTATTHWLWQFNTFRAFEKPVVKAYWCINTHW